MRVFRSSTAMNSTLVRALFCAIERNGASAGMRNRSRRVGLEIFMSFLEAQISMNSGESDFVRLEGFSATAALLRVRIVEHERVFEQRLGVVERHALQVFVALGIDEYFDT